MLSGVPMQEFAQYHLNKSSKYDAGTTDELLKGGILASTNSSSSLQN